MKNNLQSAIKNTYTIMVLVIFLFIAPCSFGKDKVVKYYYDINWKVVGTRSIAKFYRVATYPEKVTSKKRYRDYYITGELYGTGEFITIDKFDDSKTVFDGECINYFKNGKVKSKILFYKKERYGTAIEYYEDGKINKEGFYVDGKLSGSYTEYLENGAYIKIEYQKGEPVYDYYILYNSKGESSKMKFSDNTPIWEGLSINEIKNENLNGVNWQYYINNGLKVAQTCTVIRDYGKWYRVDLRITNNSVVPVQFNPFLISAYTVDKKNKTTKLAVFSRDQYLQKVGNAQALSALIVGLAEGLSTANAGYSTSTTNTITSYNGSSNSYGNVSAFGTGGSAYGSYSSNSSYSGFENSTSTTTTYDAAEAHRARVLSANRMAAFSNSQWQERLAKDVGYLESTNIKPGETITGHIHIQRKSGVELNIAIFLMGFDYLYKWSL